MCRLIKKVIIFDYDGFIADGDYSRFKFLQKSFARKGIKISNNLLKQTLGYTTSFIFNSLFKDYPESINNSVLGDYIKIYKHNIADYILPIKPTVEFIKQQNMNDIKLVIASNTDKILIESALKKFGILNKFMLIIDKSFVNKPKPDPDIYLKTINLLKLSRNKCVVIEDSITGIRAALAANLDCYIYINRYNSISDFKKYPVKGFIRSTRDYILLTQKSLAR